MRRLLISIDMEGVAGVASTVSLVPSGWEYSAYRRWMTEELNAVAAAALEAGYDEVIASDAHGNAQNIDPDLLIDNVQLIRSWPRPLLQMEMIDDESVDACAFVGYHAPAGTADGLLAHSFSGTALRSIRLNGEVASEGYLNAALAGSFGKAVLLVTGDHHALADARRYAPEAALLVTKASFGFRSQMSLPPSQVRRDLRKSAAEAFAGLRGPPFVVEPPFMIELEMTSQVAPELLGYLPWIERLDAWTVRASFQTMAEATRFLTFVIFYQPNGQIPL